MILQDCSPMGLAILSCIYIITLVGYIFLIINSFSKKRYHVLITSILVFLPLFFVTEVLTGIILREDNSLLDFFKELSLSYYLIFLALTFSAGLAIAVLLFLYSRKSISSNSLIKAFNTSKEGFLYFDNDGACLLINETMAKISSSLTKKFILNGYDFLKIVKDKTITLDNGLIYKFIDKQIMIKRHSIFYKVEEGEIINEIIAVDVTELITKNKELELDNKKLERLNEELVKYNKSMLEVIRHKEILNAKLRIHNEMNELILASNHVLGSSSNEEKMKILSRFENNALLLLKEGSYQPNEDALNNLKVLGDAIGVKIEFDNNSHVLENEKLTKLFIHASKEALTNVAKHSKSDKLRIEIYETENDIVMQFINDDNSNKKEIVMGGGLINLKKHVEDLNGKMFIINEKQFILKIEVKRNV